MSQQSNPATLREALELAFYFAERHVPSKEGYCAKCGFCHCDRGHVLAMAKQGVLAALAASGTEAAPQLIATEIGPVLARLGTSTGNVAAASPEGEEREAPEWWHEATLDVCRHARAHDPIDWQSAIKGGLLRAYNRGLDERQSAAPSGGAAHTKVWLAELDKLDTYFSEAHDSKTLLWYNDVEVLLIRALAQESKTGAVTPIANQICRCGHGVGQHEWEDRTTSMCLFQPCSCTGFAPETGAVTETK